jgi:hypothetical protein
MVSTASDTYPLPVGVTFSAATPGNLTLQEVVDQLNNSSDPSIRNFTYTLMPVGVAGSIAANSPDVLGFSSGEFSVDNTSYLTPVGRT